MERVERSPTQGRGDPEVRGAPQPSVKDWVLSPGGLVYDSRKTRLCGRWFCVSLKGLSNSFNLYSRRGEKGNMLVSTNRREQTREEQTRGTKLMVFWRSPLRRKALTSKRWKRNQNVIPVPPLKSHLYWGKLLGQHTVPVICFEQVTSPLGMSIFLPDKVRKLACRRTFKECSLGAQGPPVEEGGGGGGMLREAVATSVSWHVFVWSKEFYREKSTWKSLFMVISKGLSVLYFSPASLFLLICWLPFGSKLEVLATSPTGVQEIANTTFFMAILLPGHWGCVPGAIDHFHKVW